jgi:hypothetical protein
MRAFIGLCHCRREAGSFYYQRPVARDKPPRRKVRCCSMRCLDAAYQNGGIMIDPTEHEIAAIEAASEPAGQYIESLGRSDMATWSRDEWLCFLECVVTGYTDELQRVSGSDKPPF